jgi:penicillin-binding protein 1C
MGVALNGRRYFLERTRLELSSTAGRRLSLGNRWTRLRVCFHGAILALIAVAMLIGWIVWLGPPQIVNDLDVSTQVVDREGRLLRAYTNQFGRWRLPVTVSGIDQRYLDALVAYEDKRFWTHYGVDPLALLRAFGQLVRNGHVVSGASTLTMQVARLLEPQHERSFLTKLREIVWAIELEWKLSKQEILGLYVSLAPFGGNLEGVRAGSLAYFGREPSRLSVSEIALLIALPQSPESRRPDRSAGAARRARDRILDRIRVTGIFSTRDVTEAKRDLVPNLRRAMPMLAAHAADETVAEVPRRRVHHLTIDADLQRRMEQLLRDRARDLDQNVSIGLVAVDVADSEVLARVGSVDYFDERRSGQIDLTRTLRSPGSTLKPFIYGMAFEDGIVHPETLIDDRPMRYGSYAPKNFNLGFVGTISVRQALQFSLNVPAVSILNVVGPARLTARIKEAGGALVLPKGDEPGLAMGLGGVGITLMDLTKLYADIARLGAAAPLIERRDEFSSTANKKLLEPVAAWYLGNILIGTPPPENSVGGRIAFKTGTSYGYRDAWAIGFDGRRAIGVWVGRPDGAPVPGLAGRTTAAPILFDAFSRIGRPLAPLPPAPKGALMVTTGRLPPPLVRFRPGLLPTEDSPPPRIIFPPDGAHLEISATDATTAPHLGVLPLKVSGGIGLLRVVVNGLPTAGPSPERTLFWAPDGPGFARLTVMDARGAADSVVVWVQPEMN